MNKYAKTYLQTINEKVALSASIGLPALGTGAAAGLGAAALGTAIAPPVAAGLAVGAAAGEGYNQLTKPDSFLSRAVDSTKMLANNLYGDGTFVNRSTQAADQRLNAQLEMSKSNALAKQRGLPSMNKEQLQEGRNRLMEAAPGGASILPGFGSDNTLAGQKAKLDQATAVNRSNAYGVAVGEPGTKGLVENPATSKMVESRPATLPDGSALLKQPATPATGAPATGAATPEEMQLLKKLHASEYNPKSSMDNKNLQYLRTAMQQAGGKKDLKTLSTLAYAQQYGPGSPYAAQAKKITG
jgi:hypothetical protein